MSGETIELARQEGAEFRSVTLHARGDGTLGIEGQDMGPAAREIWGDSDYEFWVQVPAKAVQKLAFELLREKYMGQLNAVDAFRHWCELKGVAHEFGNYA